MYRKRVIYFLVILIGIVTLLVGLLESLIVGFLIPSNTIIASFDWIILIGIIFTTLGLVLLFLKRIELPQNNITFSTLEIVIIAILIISSASCAGWLFGQYQKTLLISTENIQRIDEQLKMWDEMERNNPFYCKKIVIRDDDIGDFQYYPSLEWLTNLSKRKNVKITLAVIPAILANNSETISYLNELDREYFEFATHGYTHVNLKDLSYKIQYSLIENGTNIIRDLLDYKPYTFVPPQGSGDVNTTKVLRLLGYHSITDMIGYPSYVVNFRSDLAYDKEYDPVKHVSLEEFKNSFDRFYNSSDEYYIVFLHDWTLLDEKGKLDEFNASIFEQGIDYIQSKNVQFMTIEESYQWYTDETRIRTGMVDELNYFIDFRTCAYNHTIKFNTPSSWDRKVHLVDITGG